VSENSAKVVRAAETKTATKAKTRDWREIYAMRLALTDLLVLIWVVFGVQIAWFGFDSGNVAFRGDTKDLAVSYTLISIVIVAGWMLMLGIFGTREDRVLGTGPEEYKLIANAAIRAFGLLAIVAYLFQIDVARGYILIAFPFGVVVLMFSRWMWRQWLRVQRQNGQFISKVLLVGSEITASHIARELSRHPESGYQVLGAVIPSGSQGDRLAGTRIPVLGDIRDLQLAFEVTGADTVVVTSSDDLPPERMRKLSWSLEPGRQHLVVAPSLTGISGPRIHTRPVAGLPLIHVETPRYEGRKLFTKRTFDVFGAGFLLVALSPLLLFVAILVKIASPGNVLYKQLRVGLNGKPFNMFKFRSMKVNADAELDALLEAQGRNGQPLFKIENDPRVTRIGQVLRKYSLDEFPQLLNVLRGDMSLVGPRPQRDGEVALYDSAAHRRLLLKPGMSGLWQVSGRSSLSWEDSIRLDLYYVENWSITGDLVILWRTIKAVVAPGKEAH
jgi:exopolysaccharide biosynthesis polyprenyl glycosylphosphotransferase